MEVIIKLNNQTAGRDKLARLLQYLCRFLWHRLQKNQKEGVNGIKSLEYQLSTFRKLLRLGRCVDVLYAALPLFQYKDVTVRVTVILSKIANALFLLCDHVLWFGRSDLYQVNTEKWTNLSNKYWLYSITMNLVRDFYEIINILGAHKSQILPLNGITSINDFYGCSLRALMCVHANRPVLIDTIKNGCDFFIPLTALGHVKLSPGTIGILGVISSIAGLIAIIQPLSKLSPA